MGERKAGKTWLITGCSSGFGAALARLALERGDRVAVTARRPGSIAHFAEEFGSDALCLRLDVTDPGQVRAALDEAFDAFGHLDVLVNNAGFGVQAAVEEPDDAQIRAMFEVNFFGALDLIRAALPRMREHGSGHIVNVTSVAGRTSAPLIALYSAVKYALEGLSFGLGMELAPFGIKVTTIAPGAFATNFPNAVQPPQEKLAAYGELHAFTEKLLGDMEFADPKGCARAILDVVDAPEPPRQLVAGGHAHAMVEQTLAAQAEELRAWQAVSAAADNI